METLQIGQVARRTGVSIDAIRFYEKAGLLPAPARSSGRYRLYDARALEDVAFIQKAQRLGFSLEEIRQLFAIQRHPDEVCENVRDLVAQKLAIVRNKIEELRSLEIGLSAALSRCQRTLGRARRHRETCPVLRDMAARVIKGHAYEG